MTYMPLFVRVVVNTLAIWLTSLIVNDHLLVVGGDSGMDRVLIFLAVGLVYALVNSIVKPVVVGLTGCLYVLSLGLFSLVINALMLMLTAWITEQTNWGLRLEGGFWWAVWIALVLSFINAVVTGVVYSNTERQA